jgi:hypothetical protein
MGAEQDEFAGTGDVKDDSTEKPSAWTLETTPKVSFKRLKSYLTGQGTWGYYWDHELKKLVWPENLRVH